jgi:hypothetical protein
MVELTLHGRTIPTVFNLLGSNENDLTFSLGWAIAQSDPLAVALLGNVFPDVDVGTVVAVRLQEFVGGEGATGYTDIEVESDRVAMVLEAKRGWNLPDHGQLAKYLSRLGQGGVGRLLVVAEASPEYAEPRLPPFVGDIPVVYRSWKQITQLVESCAPNVGFSQRRLLRELTTYLRGLMTMQNVTSNLVYVVPLRKKIAPWSHPYTPVEIVTDLNIYCHPVGNRYPKEPQNYVGFRWDGRLQMVRHVESYTVGNDPHEVIPSMYSREWPERHFFYYLGPPIVPPHEIRLGNGVYPSGSTHACLDLLLTCDTLTEARLKTKERLEAAGIEESPAKLA